MKDERPKLARCAVYTRKSSEEGLDQAFNSLDAQREACEAYITSQRHEGWKLVPDRYDDGGYSGGSMDRPALTRLLDDIKNRRIDIVVVYKVDRLTRALSDFAKIVEVLDGHGASFVSVTQQFNTTSSMGRLTLNILLSFAQFEREVTAERIRDKVAASKKKGMWMGGCAPLGYDVEHKQLVVDRVEAALVRTIFARYAELGCVSKLKAWLDRKGIRSKVRVSRAGRRFGGASFSRGALYQLLKNRIYLGQVRHQGKSYPGMHKAIVGQDLWDKVQESLAANRVEGAGRRRSQEPSMLAGRIFDDAGTRLTPSHAVRSGKRYRYYVRQPATGERPGKQDRRLSIAANDIESIVSAQLHALLKDQARLIDGLKPHLDGAGAQRAVLAAAQAVVENWSQTGEGPLHDFVRDVAARTVICPSGVEIHVDPRLLLGRLLGDQARPASAPLSDVDGLMIRISVAAKLRGHGGGVRLIINGVDRGDEAPRPNPVLIKAIARAHAWMDQLITGNAASIRQIAKANDIQYRYISKVLRLAFVAPEIVEAIVAGQQSDDITFAQLTSGLPLAWSR